LDIGTVRTQLPDHESLFFLELYKPERSYYTADYDQISILRNVDGKVRVIAPAAIAKAYSRQHYPVPLEGTSFEDLMHQVRQVTSTSSKETGLAIAQGPFLREPQPLFAC